jgi:2-polyprenyl-3-methyl-5-hydroxy-6-metoxy-1,4-benzoquinol methylase
VTRDDLISDRYLEEQRILHAAPRGYGGRGDKWATTVRMLVKHHQAATILDYGCGQGSLARALPELNLDEYDPAVAGKDVPPSGPYDLVVCTDVLEHVERDKVERVVDHLHALASPYLFAVISLVPTAKTLTDGRQAHILLKPQEWWRHLLTSRGFAFKHELLGPDPNKHAKEFAALLKRRPR